MRISDWSSDVCSSDLGVEEVLVVAGADGCGGVAPAAHRCLRGFVKRLSVHVRTSPVEWRSGAGGGRTAARQRSRSEEHTSELQSLMRISYAVFCLKKKNTQRTA